MQGSKHQQNQAITHTTQKHYSQPRNNNTPNKTNRNYFRKLYRVKFLFFFVHKICVIVKQNKPRKFE